MGVLPFIRNQKKKIQSNLDIFFVSSQATDLTGNGRWSYEGKGGQHEEQFKHVIEEDDGSLRRLIPVELERLNMFPDNHTEHEKVTDNKRAFFMGNALVIGVVEKIGSELSKLI